DFNPVVDRIRVVSNADQNLRLNPNDGTLTAIDTNLAFAAGDPNQGANPNVVALAYTNNFAGAGSTTLFGIDDGIDSLVRQGSPTGHPCHRIPASSSPSGLSVSRSVPWASDSTSPV